MFLQTVDLLADMFSSHAITPTPAPSASLNAFPPMPPQGTNGSNGSNGGNFNFSPVSAVPMPMPTQSSEIVLKAYDKAGLQVRIVIFNLSFCFTMFPSFFSHFSVNFQSIFGFFMFLFCYFFNAES